MTNTGNSSNITYASVHIDVIYGKSIVGAWEPQWKITYPWIMVIYELRIKAQHQQVMYPTTLHTQYPAATNISMRNISKNVLIYVNTRSNCWRRAEQINHWNKEQWLLYYFPLYSLKHELQWSNTLNKFLPTIKHSVSPLQRQPVRSVYGYNYCLVCNSQEKYAWINFRQFNVWGCEICSYHCAVLG